MRDSPSVACVTQQQEPSTMPNKTLKKQHHKSPTLPLRRLRADKRRFEGAINLPRHSLSQSFVIAKGSSISLTMLNADFDIFDCGIFDRSRSVDVLTAKSVGELKIAAEKVEAPGSAQTLNGDGAL
ncbi:hypothetical protein HDU84_006932 [Entophlyctis sp. JEL0112]|nr:hypothetical protein HDU84_006932 [Entophlyctis sp. JEL0112]